MLAEVSMLEVYGYLALVVTIGLAVYTAAALAHAVGSALLVARRYYRENPEAVPPDKFLVRLGLAGVRPRATMRRTNRPW